MFSDHSPTMPARLHALAKEILDELRDQPAAAAIILGGGVALQHYCDSAAKVRTWIRHDFCQEERG